MSDEATTNASRFNVLNHLNVPLHEVLSDADSAALLKKYGIVREQLPKIRSNDPGAKVIAAQPGQVIRITRNSPTAGKAVAYRLVVEAL